MLAKGRETANRILEAAARCIATVGLEETSVTQIAQQAQVTRSLVSHYFPKKSGIFRQVIQHILSEAYREVESPPPGLSSEGKVLHAVEANLRFFLGNPDYSRCFILLYYFASIDKEYRKLHSSINSRATSRIEQYLGEDRAGKNPADAKRIREQAESIHNELMGSIQKYFTIEKPGSASSYRLRHLGILKERLASISHR